MLSSAYSYQYDHRYPYNHFSQNESKLIKDIPKKLVLSIQGNYKNIELILDISLDEKRRGIRRFDFTDLDWYKQEILKQFNSYGIQEII